LRTSAAGHVGPVSLESIAAASAPLPAVVAKTSTTDNTSPNVTVSSSEMPISVSPM
jgi:hypothetical protein